MNKEIKIIIDCSCGENRYLRFWRLEDEKEWYVSLSYEKTDFWQKLRYVWQVIIKGNDWDTFIISEEDAEKLKPLVGERQDININEGRSSPYFTESGGTK